MISPSNYKMLLAASFMSLGWQGWSLMNSNMEPLRLIFSLFVQAAKAIPWLQVALHNHSINWSLNKYVNNLQSLHDLFGRPQFGSQT
jgi:hypothetical protein